MRTFSEFCDKDGDYNPNGKWDWYVIGGRFHSALKAKHGRRVHFDEDGYKWYVSDESRRMSGFDWAPVSELTDVNPDEFYSVLLPDGTWHECETYVPAKEGEKHGHFDPNPEWERFEELFIEPYRDGWTATVVDCHI